MSTIAALAVVTVLTVAYVLTEHPLLFVALAVVGFALIWRLYRLWDEDDRVVTPTGIAADRLYRDDCERES